MSIDKDIQKELDGFEQDINNISFSTDNNTNKLLGKIEKASAFKGIMTCDLCDKEQVTYDFNMVQEERCSSRLSANALNTAVGFIPNYQLIENLNLKMLQTKDPLEIAKLKAQCEREQTHYQRTQFICKDCAIEIQDAFKEAFWNIYKNKKGEPDYTKDATTDMFTTEVTDQERTALGTIKEVKK